MIKSPKYLTKGMRFGRWSVIGVVPESEIDSNGRSIRPSQWKYECVCDCGNIGVVVKNNLVRGKSTSCGCVRKELLSVRRSLYNEVEDCGAYYKIFFSNVPKSEPNNHAIIDKKNYALVEDFGWFRKTSHQTYYAYANAKGQFNKQKVYMHQILLPCKVGFEPDHIDRNGLNNVESNLRPVTKFGNSSNRREYTNNTSGHTGVLYNSKGKWEARISIHGKRRVLGNFDTIEEAIQVRENAQKEKVKFYESQNDY